MSNQQKQCDRCHDYVDQEGIEQSYEYDYDTGYIDTAICYDCLEKQYIEANNIMKKWSYRDRFAIP